MFCWRGYLRTHHGKHFLLSSSYVQASAASNTVHVYLFNMDIFPCFVSVESSLSAFLNWGCLFWAKKPRISHGVYNGTNTFTTLVEVLLSNMWCYTTACKPANPVINCGSSSLPVCYGNIAGFSNHFYYFVSESLYLPCWIWKLKIIPFLLGHTSVVCLGDVSQVCVTNKFN